MHNGRVLSFRPRPQPTGSRETAPQRANAFLSTPIEARTTELLDATISDGDLVAALIASLWEAGNAKPKMVSQEAVYLHRAVSSKSGSDFFFDEREYFLGEFALLAAGALRLLGCRDESERWLDRADASFRHTVAPAPHLARTAYSRLSLRFDMRRHEDVSELIPSVTLTFKKLGMISELAKCLFLEAANLKEMGNIEEAASKLEQLVSSKAIPEVFLGLGLVNLGDIRATQRNFDQALLAYRQAVPILKSSDQLYALADLKIVLATTLRQMGQLNASLSVYAEAAEEHTQLGTTTRAAFARVLFAEALLQAGRAREAEWQILSALPTIDEQKMVPEGFAAMGLLRESVRQRKTDPKALFELREYLQARN